MTPHLWILILAVCVAIDVWIVATTKSWLVRMICIAAGLLCFTSLVLNAIEVARA